MCSGMGAIVIRVILAFASSPIFVTDSNIVLGSPGYTGIFLFMI